MARIVIDNTMNPSDEMQVFDRIDPNDAKGVKLSLDLKGQKKIIEFNLSNEDARNFLKALIDILV